MTLSAQVTNAKTCTFSSAPAIIGLPSTVACTGGPVTKKVTVPANKTTKAVVHTFNLSVTGTTAPKKVSATVSTSAPPALTGVRSLVGDGYNGYCAVLSTGRMECWGDNAEGELGNGTLGGPNPSGGALDGGYDTPQAVTGITNAVSVTSDGNDSYCAVLSTGGVDCWGSYSAGQLGSGMTSYDTPHAVPGISTAVSLASDDDLSYCAVLSTGGMKCWGVNTDGELGNGTTSGPDGEDGYDTPQAVTGITKARSATSDNKYGYCAVLSTGGVDCWGYDFFGQLGNGAFGGHNGAPAVYDSPQTVTGVTHAVSVTSDGGDGYCAVLSTGGVNCWGDVLGNGTTDDADVSVAVTGISNAVSVTSDWNASYCAVLSTGGVDCWGRNNSGELGVGNTSVPDGVDGYDTPQAVTGITNAVSVQSDGYSGYCAVLATGMMKCWGENYFGELGNGTTGGPDGADGYDTPQAVTGMTTAASVSHDASGYCAVSSTSKLDCWGENNSGQLGNGTTGGPDGELGYDTPQVVSSL